MSKVAYTKGSWLVNVGQFPMVDAENGTRFEPGVARKAEETAWAKGQPTLKYCNEDGEVLDPQPEPVVPEAPKTAAPAAEGGKPLEEPLDPLQVKAAKDAEAAKQAEADKAKTAEQAKK